MDNERFQKQISFIFELDKLKHIFRKTILLDGTRNENDAEHSWHMSLAALVLSEYSNEKNLDILKILKMIILHDIVEIYAGDTFAYGGSYNSAEKFQKEQKALEKILSLLENDQAENFKKIWYEFEENKSAEANFAKALDRFMPIMHNYYTKGTQWKKYNVSRNQVYELNKHIAKGSEFLWEFIQKIIEESVEKEYLFK